MRDSLLGSRVLVKKGGGLVYGVARVRYNEGHAYGGSYEIETADGNPFLAVAGECTLGANWDVTPEEGRFTGEEFYRPVFLDGATVQDSRLFARSGGVTVPSDPARVRELAARVKPGRTVYWDNTGSNEFRGELVVAGAAGARIGLENPKGKKGGHPTGFTWPVEAGPDIGPQYAHEFLVDTTGGPAAKDRLTFIRVSPKRYGKGPAASLILTFGREVA